MKLSYFNNPSAKRVSSTLTTGCTLALGTLLVSLPLQAAPILILSGSTDFGYVLLGETALRTMQVTNDASNSNPSNRLSGTFGAVSGEFAPNTIESFGPLNKGSKASRNYTYTPVDRGADSQSLSITSNDTNNANKQVTLTGTGVAPVNNVATTDAGPTRIGTSSTATITVNNTGDGNLSGLGATSNLNGTVGTGSGNFTGTGGTLSLADGAATNFNYIYSPTGHGTDTANISLDFNNGSSDGKNLAQSFSVALSGTGVGPEFSGSYTPGSTHNYGTIQAGTTESWALDITNATTDDGSLALDLIGLTLLDITLGGSDAGLFSLSGFTGPTVLGKGETLSLLVGYNAPSVAGTYSNAWLNILTDQGAASDESGQSFKYYLTGGAFVSTPQSSTPEPSSLALFGAAFAGLGLIRRRKKAS